MRAQAAAEWALSPPGLLSLVAAAAAETTASSSAVSAAGAPARRCTVVVAVAAVAAEVALRVFARRPRQGPRDSVSHSFFLFSLALIKKALVLVDLFKLHSIGESLT